MRFILFNQAIWLEPETLLREIIAISADIN